MHGLEHFLKFDTHVWKDTTNTWNKQDEVHDSYFYLETEGKLIFVYY